MKFCKERKINLRKKEEGIWWSIQSSFLCMLTILVDYLSSPSILICNGEVLSLNICDASVSITLFAEQCLHVSATISIGIVKTPSLRYKREGTESLSS